MMELKNLVKQCLATKETNQDSFSLTLNPMMSSVLGLSHSGGVTRYMLPYNQVPAHYHKLLGFPTGLQACMSSPTATTTGLLSPSSTTSLLHPGEENSQVYPSPDCPDGNTTSVSTHSCLPSKYQTGKEAALVSPPGQTPVSALSCRLSPRSSCRPPPHRARSPTGGPPQPLSGGPSSIPTGPPPASQFLPRLYPILSDHL